MLHILAEAAQTTLETSIDHWIPVILAIIGTGGIGGAIVAFLKVRPEAGQIAVTASEGALVVQTGVIDTLRKENDQLRVRLENMESKVAMMMDLRDRVEYVEKKNKDLTDKNEKLRRRVFILEKQVRDLGQEPIENGHGY